MNESGSVIIKIAGDDEDLRNKLSAVGKVAAGAMKATVGAIAAAGTALAGLGAASIKVGAEFETSMAKASTLFGEVAVDVDGLQSKILEVSSKTGVAASALGESLYSALSAGIPVTEDMTEATLFLEKSAKLATAGFTDIDTALSATAKTINAYGMGVEDTDKIQKVMIQTQNLGITTVGELGASLAQVTPTAAAFGVSFEQVGASLANMTAMGTPTAQATTQLNALIAELGKSGTAGAKGLEEATKGTKYAGMNFKEMMDLGAPLNEILDLMGGYANKSGKSMVDMFGSLEAGKAAMAISGENSAKFASNLEAMGTSADVVGIAYEKMTNTLEFKLGALKTSMENLGITAYQEMQGPVVDAVGAISGYVDELGTVMKAAFSENNTAEEAGKMAAALHELGYSWEDASSIIGGGMSGVFLSLGNILSDAVSDIVAQAPMMIDAGVAMVSSFLQGIGKNSDKLGEGALSIIESLVGGIFKLIPEIATTAAQLIQSFASGLAEKLPELVPFAVEAIATLVEHLSGNADQILGAGIEILVALGEGMINAIPTLIEKVPQIIICICDVINENATDLLFAALGLMVQLGKGLWDAIPTLVDNIPRIIEAMVKAFFAFQWLSLGSSLIKAIGSGVKSAGTGLVNVASDVSASFFGGFKALPDKLFNIGKSVVDGLIKGIRNKLDLVGKAAKEMGVNIISTFTDFFQINSPSKKVAKEVGVAIPEGLAKGIKDGSSKAEKAAAKLAKATFDASKDWIDERKYYSELSLEEELGVWESVQRQYKYGSEEQKKANKEVYRVQKEIEKASFDTSKGWIDKKKQYNNLSLAEELQAWRRVQERFLEGSKERMDADEKVFDVKSKITKELERLEGAYASALEKRTGEIFKSFGLFEGIKEETEVSGKDLMKNLEDQIGAMESFYGDLEELSAKGVSPELVESIRGMGVDAAGELDALLSLSGDQLQKYSDLFTEKQVLSSDLAAAELSGLREETDNEIATLLTGIEEEFAVSPDLGLNMSKGLADGILSGMSDVIAAAIAVAKAAVTAATDELEIKSPSRVMRDKVGRMIPRGIAVGIEAEMPSLERRLTNAYHQLRDGFTMGSQRFSVGAEIGSMLSGGSGMTTTNHGGDVILNIDKIVNDGKGSTAGLLQEAEFYRKQRAMATGGI